MTAPFRLPCDRCECVALLSPHGMCGPCQTAADQAARDDRAKDAVTGAAS